MNEREINEALEAVKNLTAALEAGKGSQVTKSSLANLPPGAERNALINRIQLGEVQVVDDPPPERKI